jgi:hypothetical protein
MIPQDKGCLKLYVNGGVPLKEVVDYFDEVDNAYNSLYVFELLIDRIKEVEINKENTLNLFLSHTLYSKKKYQHNSREETDILVILNHWPPTEKRIASFVPKQDKRLFEKGYPRYSSSPRETQNTEFCGDYPTPQV